MVLVICISKILRSELDIARTRNSYRVLVKFMEETGYKLMYLTIIIPAVLSGQTFLPGDIFFVMSAAVLMRSSMMDHLPKAIFGVLEMLVSLRRFQV